MSGLHVYVYHMDTEQVRHMCGRHGHPGIDGYQIDACVHWSWCIMFLWVLMFSLALKTVLLMDRCVVPLAWTFRWV